MQATAGIRAALAAVAAAPEVRRVATDDALLADLAEWEAIGRLVDARRTAAAAEVEWRSRPNLGEQSLAAQHGARDGADLVASVARIRVSEAKRRIGLGTALAPRVSLTGEELPGRYPHVTAAVTTGSVGVDAARVVVEALQAVRRRSSAEDRDAAERMLTAEAMELTPDLLRVQATAWQARLDPDGPEPAETHASRVFRLGCTDADGMTSFSGRMTPETAATVKAGLQAHRRGVRMTYEPAGGERAEDLEAHWVEAEGDHRTRTQYDHDVFFSIFAAGVRAEQEGAGGSGKVPHEVLVHVDAADLERRRGCGWVAGILARLSVPAVERMQCAGGTRLVVLGGGGEPLHLGQTVRRFTGAQKKALAARDGGCAWPGCTAPVAWTEAHHITWWARDGGPTDVDNGVLLCGHHHHVVHANDRYEIRLHERRPHLVPRHWQGPPQRRHRMQRHPIAAIRGAPPGG